ncbi:succinate dehydrogenase, cytochrome b556 subunit [Novosphingobium bradum]|uniref:Succinate dehydrogenase cytochrome b556 subunit n=1 Tax=Novosphingobium bradum TaxID=1737444 RepID=A0ABV7IRD0_9SPHN
MASANPPGAKSRPLSPHLQIWRWGPAMVVSILHRATGGGLAVVGLAVLLWWLGALVTGPEAYATFTAVMGSPLGLVVLVGLTWAFFQHLCSGVRHFVLDIGAGFELDANAHWSVITMVVSVLLTAGTWACIFAR